MVSMLIDGNKRKACPEKSHFVAPGFTYFVLILRSVWLIGLGWFYAFLIDKMVNSTIRFFEVPRRTRWKTNSIFLDFRQFFFRELAKVLVDG